MIEVEVPGKGIAEFPDGMNPLDIEHSLYQTWPELADNPIKQKKAYLLKERSDLMGQPFGVPMREMQEALAEGLTEGLTTPFAKIPRPEIKVQDQPGYVPMPVAKFIDAAFERAIQGVEAIETPLSGLMIASGAVVPRAVAGAVGLMGADQVIQGGKRIVEGVREKDPTKIGEGTVDLAMGSGMGYGAIRGFAEASARSAGVDTDSTVVAAENHVINRKLLPLSTEVAQTIIPPERQLTGTGVKMPEFSGTTYEEGAIRVSPTIPPERQLISPNQMPEVTESTANPPSKIITHGTEPGETIERISLPVEPETAKKARQIWSKPIDFEAQVEGADALRQLVSMTEETKTKGKPYEPPTVNVDLRQLERVMQRNSVSKVESWADEVLQRKLGETGANPFFDPEFIAAAMTKGAILVKRGVKAYDDWASEMRKQFGRGMDDKLPDIFKQVSAYDQRKESIGGKEVKSTAETPLLESKPETGPGATGMGAATPSEFPEKPPLIDRFTESISKPLRKVQQTAAELIRNAGARETATFKRDVVDNAARKFAREQTSEVAGDVRRTFKKDEPIARDALAFAIESGMTQEGLDAARQKLIASENADPAFRKRAVDAIDFAKYHLDELAPIARRYSELTDSQVATENAHGIDTLKHPNYVMHAQDVEGDVTTGMMKGSSGDGNPSGFKKVREFPTFADSIAAGVKPRTLDAVALLESRLSNGQMLVNKRLWMEGLKDLVTADGEPIGKSPEIVTRADGSTYPAPPKGYTLEYAGPGQPIAIKNGFEGVFSALTDPSAWSRTAPGRVARDLTQGGKSFALLFDTFHLGRVSVWDALIKTLGIKTFKLPIPEWVSKRTITLLDKSIPELNKMADAGEIPESWLADLGQAKREQNIAIQTGFNIGRISDALHQDLIQKIPGIGTMNKWLFDQYQRAAMMAAWRLEFQRRRMGRPEETELETGRQVSKDLNIRFGNLGRQGLFKSRTAQDSARFLTLAPQWNEGLIRSELGAVKQLGELAIDVKNGERLYAGVLLRSVGAMAVMQFVANQIINYATRGYPTWENPEEGVGAKLSAWLPDLVSGGPGFFLHPLGLAAETTHLLLKAYERTGDFAETLRAYIRSRISTTMRPIMDFVTQSDFLGRKLKPGTVWGQMAKDAVPVPIGGSAIAQAAKSAITGQRQETFAGQFQKQAMSSVGIKTDQAPSPESRIRALATEFNKSKGIEQKDLSGASDYGKLVNALRLDNKQDAESFMQDLRDVKRDKQILQHFMSWPKAMFTGQKAREAQFFQSLNDEQKAQYRTAKSQRIEIARKAQALLHELQQKKPQESP